jgi:integrase
MRKEVLFEEWATEWLKRKRSTVKESTYALYYVVTHKHLLPFFGKYGLNKISWDLIQRLIHRQLEGKKSIRSVKTIVTILKACLNAAMRENFMRMKSLRSTFPYQERRRSLDVLSVDEQKTLLQAVRRGLDSRSLGIAICLLTGMRIGELCALQYKDIDFERRLLFISKTLVRGYGGTRTKHVLSSPKSKSSIREIPISFALLEILQEMNYSSEESFILSGSLLPVEPNTFRRFFYAFLKKAEVRKVNVHALRHTFATTLVKIGTDITVLSKILGHADVLTTQKFYVHPQIEQKRECVEKISKLLQ